MMWFKRHPEWLQSEASRLQNDSNYAEIIQWRENLFISHGEIIVRVGKTYHYPVLIVFPEATPFEPPSVYILNKKLGKEEIQELSMLTSLQISSRIKEHIQFLNLRHQNESGSVCFLEAENLYHENAQIIHINEIIRKVQRWLAGIFTNRFPPDSAEVELFHHFKNRDDAKYILLTNVFYNRTVVKGEFYAAQNRFLLDRDFKTYLGLIIIGQNRQGISLPPLQYPNEQHVLFTRCPSMENIIKKSPEIEKLITDEDLIKGHWWDIDEEPGPFDSFDELARLVGKNDIGKGYQELANSLENAVSYCSQNIYLGLRFLNRKKDFEWIVLRLVRNKAENGWLLSPQEKEIIEKFSEYNIVAVKSEKFDDNAFHIRNKGRAERDILRNSHVTIIGCGAIGSEVADNMAKAGLGNISLIDNQIFHAHNAVRHLVRLDRVSLPKVLAVAEELVLHNPFVDVSPVFCNILNTPLNEYLRDGHIGLSSIADDNIEGYLNEQAVINNKIVFYVRALRGGKAARIFRVIPGVDACKNCLALYAETEDSKFVKIPEDPNLPTIMNECNNPIRPASAADLKLIASIFSRVVINYLQTDEHDKNHWIWYSEDLENLPLDPNSQFSLFSSFLAPNPKCTICIEPHPIPVRIFEKVVQFIINEIDIEPEVETGGILVGTLDDNGSIVVRFASGPGPSAIKEKTRFEKDISYCQQILDEKYRQSQSNGVYVGEWHYHPSGSNHPSDLDLDSLYKISQQNNYLTDKPIMLIFSQDKSISCTVHPFNKRYYHTNLESINS